MPHRSPPPPPPPPEPPAHGGDRITGHERSLALLFDSIRQYAILGLDVQGRIVAWNAGADRVHGWRADAVLGRHVSILVDTDPAARARCDAALQHAAEAGSLEDEDWYLRPDGSRFKASILIDAMRDETGALIGFAQVTRDLSEPRRPERELRDSERRLRLMIESVRDYAIFTLDPQGLVTSWNAAAERIKGWTAAEIVGRHFSQLYPEDQVRSGKCERELAIAAGEGRYEDESLRRRKDGSEFWANVIITPLRDATGRLIGFVKITRDLTERRRAEQERLELAQAQEAVRLRDEFLSIAAHELRTPLTALQLQIEALHALPGLDPKFRHKLERAARSGERLAALITALLDVSHIATGGVTLEPSSFDLLELVHDVVHEQAETARNAGSALIVSGQPGLVGAWDRLRIHQALTNLLSNALKYGAGSPIELAVSRDGDLALLEVRDRGPGVSESDRERIFGRFQRAAPLRNYGGLGLGLYVAREIIDAHGGSITVKNLAGRGACFGVRLPLPEKRHHSGDPAEVS